MTLLDVLIRAGAAGVNLVALLRKVAAAAPDLAPEAQRWIDALESSVSQSNLVSLAATLPTEIANIAKGQIEPRDHPSDAI